MELALGVDVGGTNVRVAAVDSRGQIVLLLQEPTSQQLVQQIHQMTEKIKFQVKQPLLGIGLGWPGAVRQKDGLVLETPNLKQFQNFPLKAELISRLGMKVEIENDAKCAALGESRFGVAQGLSDFILLTFGTGIGGALCANSQLIRGSSGLAGEMGHLCLYPNGLKCGCGGLGCLEQYVSARALERRAFEKFNCALSSREILEETSSKYQDLINDYVSDLAVGLRSLVNIFNPEAVIFAGGLFTSGGGPLLEKLETQLRQQGFPSNKQKLKLLASSLGGTSGILGAASLCFPLIAVQ